MRPSRDNRDPKKQRRLRDRARSYLLELEVDGKLGAWRDELLEVRFRGKRRSRGE